MIDIEIDNKKIQILEGTSVIEAADANDIYIPRFCYHKKLSIVANCRMCLVEIEGMRKPMPACATTVTPGMKIFTQSSMALKAQRSVMEFLLINHPLDCPICDQGGECELQDLSMGFGCADSEYKETKRAVFSEDLGPLVETEMTRCIQCTRCVRFGEEIAGLRELGATGRGEHMEIGTYVKHFMQSELSGNIIDICPVGALTNKPSRYQGRSWEYKEHAGIAPHDCVGTNLFIHTRARQLIPQRHVMRTVPRDNESINEAWMSDRDRYSCEAIYHDSRLKKPMMKKNNHWIEVTWERALLEIADRTNAISQNQSPQQIAAIASPNSTCEEFYLLQKMLRALGSDNVDHRVREHDFSDQTQMPAYLQSDLTIADLESQDAILLVGSNIRYEQPMLNLRVRKAALDDAVVMTVNPMDYDFTFPVAEKIIASPNQLTMVLAQIVNALANKTGKNELAIANAQSNKTADAIADKLISAEKVAILIGQTALHNPQASNIRALVKRIAELASGKLMLLTDGANSHGAWLAGMTPNETNAKSLLTDKPVRAYYLLNIEPELDTAYPKAALNALNNAGLVVCFNPYASETMKSYADFILPVAPFSETPGTFVNVEGTWQSFAAVTPPHGDSKPAWKVLRVLANFLNCEDFDYKTVHEVHHELKEKCKTENKTDTASKATIELTAQNNQLSRLAPWPIYRIDNLVRRASALQETQEKAMPDQNGVIRINATLAQQLNLNDSDSVTALQDNMTVTCPLKIDNRIADNTVYLPSGLLETAGFGETFAPIELKRGV